MNFDQIFTPIKIVWVERSVREQALLCALGAFILAITLWFSLVSPVWTWRSDAQRAHALAIEDYEQILFDLARYRTLAANADTTSSMAPLRTVIGKTANERDLAITRVQPLEDGGLTVWLDSVHADNLTAWLVQLAREHSVSVERVSLDREGDGIVRAQLVLKRAGG